MDKLTIQFKSIDAGWCTIVLQQGDQSFSERLSYLSDGLGDFARLACAIARDRGQCAHPRRIFWQDEPGAWSLRVVDGEHGLLDVTLSRHAKTFPVEDDPGEAMTRFQVSPSRLCRTVLRTFDEVMREMSVTEYHDRWRYRWPSEALDELRTSLHRL